VVSTLNVAVRVEVGAESCLEDQTVQIKKLEHHSMVPGGGFASNTGGKRALNQSVVPNIILKEIKERLKWDGRVSAYAEERLVCKVARRCAISVFQKQHQPRSTQLVIWRLLLLVAMLRTGQVCLAVPRSLL
jgi:hypothetical protein